MSRAAEAEVFERDPMAIVDALVRRGRVALDAFADSDQARVDEAVAAIAWSLYKPAHAETLAAMAVEDTGLGNAADKVLKNQRKTFGTLRDLMRVKSVGIIEEQPALGLVKYAKPVGVVCAVTPSTNPAATPVNKTMMALKGRNAIVIAPSPGGLATTTHAVALMRTELQKIGAPADLVQVLPAPVDKAITHALMAACDLVVACQRRLKIRPKGGAKDCHLGWWSDLGVRLGVGDAVRGFFGGSGQRSHAELKRSAPAGRPQGGMVYRIGVSLATRALGARCRPGPSDGVPQFSYRHCFCGRGFG